jgi:hypothetical protein
VEIECGGVELIQLALDGVQWLDNFKCKVDPVLYQVSPQEDVLWEWRYSSTHSLILALDGGEWSASRLGRFTPQGTSPQHPLDRRLSKPQSRSEHGVEEKNSQPPPGIELRSSSPWPSPCTD